MSRLCATHHICDCNMERLLKLEKENESYKKHLQTFEDSIRHSFKTREDKLQLENKVLKEQLKLAESQIDDLKQQVDELNKAVYQENGED